MEINIGLSKRDNVFKKGILMWHEYILMEFSFYKTNVVNEGKLVGLCYRGKMLREEDDRL